MRPIKRNAEAVTRPNPEVRLHAQYDGEPEGGDPTADLREMPGSSDEGDGCVQMRAEQIVCGWGGWHRVERVGQNTWRQEGEAYPTLEDAQLGVRPLDAETVRRCAANFRPGPENLVKGRGWHVVEEIQPGHWRTVAVFLRRRDAIAFLIEVRQVGGRVGQLLLESLKTL